MKLDNAQLLLDEQPISIDVLLEKYAKGDEKTVDEVRRRVARGLAQVEKPELRARWEKRFYEAMVDGFIPGGRINSAAGTGIAATLINCFVQPVGDAITGVDDGMPGIYLALNQAAETMRRGGGVGYDFSPIRPKSARVHGTALARERPDLVHARVRQELRDGRIGGRAARRADGRAALRPPGHRGVHQRQARRLALQLQHVGRGHRRVHARGRSRRRDRAVACRPSRSMHRTATSASTATWVYRKGQRARAVRPDHAVHLRPRRAGRDVHRPRQRDNNLSYCETIAATNPCGEQSLAPVRLLLPGLDQPDDFVNDPFGRAGVV